MPAESYCRAYNPICPLPRWIKLPEGMADWSLTSLQQHD